MAVREEKILLDTEEEHTNTGSPFSRRVEGSRALIQTTKSVVMRNEDSLTVDSEVVSPVLYNSFHYSLLPQSEAHSNFVIGVTSTRDGDGKTLVASNLAVSLALADERETVLVDLNLRKPNLHSVFALGIGPGLAEALTAPMVHVARTTVRHLHVMTLGNISSTFSGLRVNTNGKKNGKSTGKGNGKAHPADMSGMPGFKHVMQSLRQRFEVIIFDMPSVSDPILPLNLTRQMDGMVLVVDSSRTTKDDIMRVAQRLGRERLLGFVLNRVRDVS